LEQCPECEKWTFEYDLTKRQKVCYNSKCGHTAPAGIAQFMKDRNISSKLASHPVNISFRQPKDLDTVPTWDEL